MTKLIVVLEVIIIVLLMSFIYHYQIEARTVSARLDSLVITSLSPQTVVSEQPVKAKTSCPKCPKAAQLNKKIH
jgi:hypothetical protein